MPTEDEMYGGLDIPGFVQNVYDQDESAYSDSRFFSYLYGVERDNPGALQRINSVMQPRDLYDVMYSRYSEGERITREGLQEDAREARNAPGTLSYEEQQEMGYDNPRGGSYNQLSEERRDLYTKQDDGSYRLLKGQHRKENGQRWVEEGSEADRWPAIRNALNMQSLSEDAIPISPVQSFVLMSFRGTNPDFIAPSPNGPRPPQARVRGRYASAPQINFAFKESDALSTQIGNHIREQIVYNYTHSTIHQDTGTLLQAIQDAEVKVTVEEDGKAILVVVTLADITRPPQPGRDGGNGHAAEEVTTGDYGSWVFRGRRAMFPVTSAFLRFNTGEHGYNSQEEFGNWHTTRSVMASEPHPEVFTLTDENMKQLYKDVQVIVQGALSVQNTPQEN